jgi:hypothetical protein
LTLSHPVDLTSVPWRALLLLLLALEQHRVTAAATAAAALSAGQCLAQTVKMSIRLHSEGKQRDLTNRRPPSPSSSLLLLLLLSSAPVLGKVGVPVPFDHTAKLAVGLFQPAILPVALHTDNECIAVFVIVALIHKRQVVALDPTV